MQKTGKIASIIPTQAGGYNTPNGYIYTFNMTVQCPDGQVMGEIGSKAQAYPKQVGEEIIVNVTNTEHGVRLKKINPGFQQQGQQGNQGRSQAPDPQRDLCIKRGNSLNAIFSATTIPSDMVANYLVAAMGWLETGQWNLSPSYTEPVNDGQPTDDESIPF